MLPRTAQDALGQRALADPAALPALLAFAHDHAPALAAVAARLRPTIGLEGSQLTTRLKPLRSLLDALQAGVPLSRMPDVAGVRLTGWFGALDEPLARLVLAFPGATVHDTRASDGYRAVHLAVDHEGAPVEIQVRTTAQQRWSDAEERLRQADDEAPLTAWRAVSARLAALEDLHLAERVLERTGRRRDPIDLSEADVLRAGRPMSELRTAHQRFENALAACPSELRRLLFRPPNDGSANGPAWFVLVYDRRRRRPLLAERHVVEADAWARYAALALFYAGDPTVEVVRIGVSSEGEAALRSNHGRYFLAPGTTMTEGR